MLALDLEVVFEDNHLLVVNKPVGIPTQKDPYAEISLEEIAKDWLKVKHEKPGNVFLQPVHRIDKPVSGLVLFAKTSKALSRLNLLMREKAFQKTYVAITDGYPPSKKATLEHYLVHDDHYARISFAHNMEAKLAILHYQVVEKGAGISRMEIELVTGRYHQIRAQLAAIGCPVLGDKRYGSPSFFKEGIALCHVRMQFIHPVSKIEMDIRIDPSF